MIPFLNRFNTSFFSFIPQSILFAEITVHFKSHSGELLKSPKCQTGITLLEVAHDNHVDLEGACDGCCACSTCHVIVDEEWFDKLDEAHDEEEDMLDLAYGLEDTSRLACQIELEPRHDGLTVSLPEATRNMYVDGHVPEPH